MKSVTKSALLVLVILVAGAQAIDTSTYPRSQELKAGLMKIFWKINGPDIELVLEAQATGWVGFGLGETRGMQGADVVYYEHATNRLTDAYVTTSNAKPITDESQDWTLIAAETSSSKLTVEIRRSLSPADTVHDRSITNDEEPWLPTPVIAAWGNSGEISYHASNRVGSVVRFFGPQGSGDALAALKAGGFSTHDFLVPNFPVPTQSSSPFPADQSGTAYVEFCLDVPALGDTNVAKHVVGFEAVIKPETEKYIHHYTLYGVGDADASVPTYGTCAGQYGGNKREMVWLWAPGVMASKLPDQAGIRILGSGIKAFVLQVHYDNPSSDTGKVDSSGFRIYYTTTLRANDAAVLEIGDPAVVAARSPETWTVPAGLSKITIRNDAASCTNRFQDESITVFTRFLHMHQVGTHMTVTQESAANTVIRKDAVDYYDFKQSGAFEPRSTGQGFQISKGDTFTVECWFNNPGTTPRRFGLGSSDEMCIDYIYYYPLQPGLSQCHPSGINNFPTSFPRAVSVSSVPRTFANAAINDGGDQTDDSSAELPTCHELGYYCGDGGCDCDHCCGTPWALTSKSCCHNHCDPVDDDTARCNGQLCLRKVYCAEGGGAGFFEGCQGPPVFAGGTCTRKKSEGQQDTIYLFQDKSRAGPSCVALDASNNAVASESADHCCQNEDYCCSTGDQQSCGAGSDECGHRFRCPRLSGEDVCERHGFDKSKCLSIGCCQWDPATTEGCWSNVGDAVCEPCGKFPGTCVAVEHTSPEWKGAVSTFTQSGCSGTVTTSNGQETLTSTFKVSGSGDNAKIWSDDAAGGWSSGDSFDGTSMEIIASDKSWKAVVNCGCGTGSDMMWENPWSWLTLSGAGNGEVNGVYEWKSDVEPNTMPHNTLADSRGVWVQRDGTCWIGFSNVPSNPEWRKWTVFCNQGAVYAVHTGGKRNVPPRAQWEVSDWINDNGKGHVLGVAGAAPAPTCTFSPVSSYVIEDWNAHSCSQGSPILTLEDCRKAAGAYLSQCGLVVAEGQDLQSQTWGGPQGCHIQRHGGEGGGDFQFNANFEGGAAVRANLFDMTTECHGRTNVAEIS